MNSYSLTNVSTAVTATSTIGERILALSNNRPLVYASVGCLAMLAILYLNGSIARAHKTTHNQYIIRENEVLPDVSYYTHRGDQIIHIFWTGDLYSTWLVCYYFIAAEQPVQPIYLIPKSKVELSVAIDRMTKIRNILVARYPHKKARLLPTYYATNISKNNSITYCITKIHGRSPWLDTQVMNILDRQARFAADWPWPILSAMLPSSQLPVALSKYSLSGQWLDARLSVPELSNLRFPLLTRNTDELNRISLDSKHYFYDLLLLVT